VLTRLRHRDECARLGRERVACIFREPGCSLARIDGPGRSETDGADLARLVGCARSAERDGYPKVLALARCIEQSSCGSWVFGGADHLAVCDTHLVQATIGVNGWYCRL